MRWRVLGVRAVLGVFFAVFLGRFFFPEAPGAKILVLALLLVFSAYILEALRSKGQ